MISKNKFSIMLGKNVINEYMYELERSKENEREVIFRSYTAKDTTKKQIMTFETELTDEEIQTFFNEKHEAYSAEIAKKWFFLKSVPIVKFSKEIELFLAKK